MSKRIVKDPVTEAELQIRRTPQPRRGMGRSAKSQNYFKRNYIDVLKIITPDLYWDDDQSLSGVEVSELDQLINSNILLAATSGAVFASSIAPISYLSALNTISGISQFFVKQNNLTWITPQKFEDTILHPLKVKAITDAGLSGALSKSLEQGIEISDFASSSAFLDWISGTLLPTIDLTQEGHPKSAGPAQNPGSDLGIKTLNAYSPTTSGTHKYLIDNLAWVYFLNVTDPAGTAVRPDGYATSGELAKLLTEKLWNGKTIALEDTMKVLQKYIWGNYSYFSGIDEKMLPEKYRVSGTGHFTSGVQLRDRLETLAGIVYSDAYFDNTDRKVEDAFSDYISTTSLITDTEYAGPFTRFMKALGFSFAERSGEAGEIETLLDIESCPDEFLPYLADLIGWVLIGNDASRHRNQLRQAVSIYKAKGTKRSVQYVADAVFGTSSLNLADNQLYDLWESYLPNLIFYTLATSSALTKDGLNSFTRAKATELGLDNYSQTNLEHNIRVAVDRIMFELIGEFPDNFVFSGAPFPRVQFYYADDPLTPNLELPYNGPWVKYPSGKYYTLPDPPETIINESNLSLTNTFQLIPVGGDPTFEFEYRGRELPFPPWEEMRYYQECTLTDRLLEALRFKLACFGVYSSFNTVLIDYIKQNTIKKDDIDYLNNSILFFTPKEEEPPNYGEIVSLGNPQSNECVKYLPYWNSKSSHFKLKFSASSFDFIGKVVSASSSFALDKIKTLVNTAAPAHAIPEVILDVSTVDDARIEVSALGCMKATFPVSSLATCGASSTILINYAASTVNPAAVLPVALWASAGNFRRADASSLKSPIYGSGTYDTSVDIFFGGAGSPIASVRPPWRNSLRRKNHKYYLNHEEIDLRDGIGSPGFNFLWLSKQLSSIYGVGDTDLGRADFATSGGWSLGFMPSSLSYKEVPLTREPWGFSNLIDVSALHEVWDKCQAYYSSSVFFGIQVSTTFPHRGFVSPDSDDCSAFFSRRESLTDLLALMHRVSYFEKKLEASSIVSGYFLDDGSINPTWPVSSYKIQPTTLSSWYYEGPYRDVETSIANQLEETDPASATLNYMEDFSFGRKLHTLYKSWITHYGRQPLNLNYATFPDTVVPTYASFGRKRYSPSILSHTYGPYLFNSDFEIMASALTSVPTLVTSSIDHLVVLDYGADGQGVLSNNTESAGDILGMENNYEATATSDMYVQIPEIRNDAILSGIEFVATKRPNLTTVTPHARDIAFAVLKINKIKNVPAGQTTLPDAYNRTLEDNVLIRYHRHFDQIFPRLRYKIEPDQEARLDLQNFLLPESEYSLNVKAVNIIDIEGSDNSTLKVWIHTEPISYTYSVRNPDGGIRRVTEESVWSFVNNRWVKSPLSKIVGSGGRSYVEAVALSKKFGQSTEESISTELIETGTARSVYTNDYITPYIAPPMPLRMGCVQDVELEAIDPVITAISEYNFENMEFLFNTNNKLVPTPPNEGVPLHTKDRKYYIEIFAKEAVSHGQTSIIFDNISMKNKTLQDKAVVQTKYGDYDLSPRELKACLKYFSNLSEGLASRNAIITSGTMETSGGSRLNYRDNVNRSIPAWSANHDQVSKLIIRGP